MFSIPTLVAFLYELFLAIPFIGGSVALGSGLSTVWIAFIIHAAVLVFRIALGYSKFVPIIALMLTCLTWIPFIAWVCHLLIAILYFCDFFFSRKAKR